MSNSEMVLVPRALLGAVASALETGNPAPKTLVSVRELYLSDDFPDSKDMQEAGKFTSGADWAQEAIDMEAADFSDALMWLKEGKRVCRSGWNGAGQYVILIPGEHLAKSAGYGFGECIGEFTFGNVLALKNAQNIMQPGWVPSMGDLMADDWQVYGANLVSPAVPAEAVHLVTDMPPHQLRVLEELAELSNRLKALGDFIESDKFKSIDKGEGNLLVAQHAHMKQYQDVLSRRVASWQAAD